MKRTALDTIETSEAVRKVFEREFSLDELDKKISLAEQIACCIFKKIEYTMTHRIKLSCSKQKCQYNIKLEINSASNYLRLRNMCSIHNHSVCREKFEEKLLTSRLLRYTEYIYEHYFTRESEISSKPKLILKELKLKHNIDILEGDYSQVQKQKLKKKFDNIVQQLRLRKNRQTGVLLPHNSDISTFSPYVAIHQNSPITTQHAVSNSQPLQSQDLLNTSFPISMLTSQLQLQHLSQQAIGQHRSDLSFTHLQSTEESLSHSKIEEQKDFLTKEFSSQIQQLSPNHTEILHHNTILHNQKQSLFNSDLQMKYQEKVKASSNQVSLITLFPGLITQAEQQQQFLSKLKQDNLLQQEKIKYEQDNLNMIQIAIQQQSYLQQRFQSASQQQLIQQIERLKEQNYPSSLLPLTSPLDLSTPFYQQPCLQILQNINPQLNYNILRSLNKDQFQLQSQQQTIASYLSSSNNQLNNNNIYFPIHSHNFTI